MHDSRGTGGAAFTHQAPEAQHPWHTQSAADTASALGVDPSVGLSGIEVAARQAQYGLNQLAEDTRTPAWKKILRPLSDKMTMVLIVAAAASAVVSQHWETPVVILAVITLNTLLNYVQEARAESSLSALRDLSIAYARVCRDAREIRISRTEVVPGDVVLLEAGDSVPADGRMIRAVRVQVAEAALTGESQPVDKTVEVLDDPELPVAERANMLFMNTDVTRGRAVMVVTATGMSTQMGAIASLLRAAGGGKTPLQLRIDQLAQLLTIVAVIVVAVVFALGLARGESWTELLLTAVSLAVATIPEGLPAVVVFTLALGASRLAQRGAIIKHLSAVETLGSTADIATDKTGTLTLNEMSVQRLIVTGRGFRVSGEGYSTDGKILTADARPVTDLTDALLAMALCNDASVRDGDLVGDPTEGALVVLAEKGGIDVEGARRSLPRLAEVPFDSEYKYMATLHQHATGDTAGYRLCVKGASGVLLDKADSVLGDDGPRPLTQEDRDRIHRRIDELAAEGLRTLMIAGRDIADPAPPDTTELSAMVDHLTVYAAVGIMDPPRKEAANAIKTALGAGIAVHMITGDNLTTATAIANTLAIPGESASGVMLDGLSDQQLRARATDFGVLARVAPDHKIRFVRALQARGRVVAMTGDGVNDAPALKQADIGIAMGITGTDVSKGAADMILTDDNFSTIVAAIREGRGIYANIVKFVKFQLTTAWGFVLIFLTTGVLGMAGGAPFTALQILWVNIIMDGPPALALGVEPTEPDVMRQKPRPTDERLLNWWRLRRILALGIIMTVGTVAVLAAAPELFPTSAGDPRFATTLAFTTFVFYQVFNLLNVRSDIGSAFSMRTFTNHAIWVSLAVVVVLQVLVVHLDVLQGLFDTTALTSAQWLFALAVGSTVLWIDELGKAIVRAHRRHVPAL